MDLTTAQINSLQLAGCGNYKPMGDRAITRCDELVTAGLLMYNPTHRMYFITEHGAQVLSTCP